MEYFDGIGRQGGSHEAVAVDEDILEYPTAAKVQKASFQQLAFWLYKLDYCYSSRQRAIIDKICVRFIKQYKLASEADREAVSFLLTL